MKLVLREHQVRDIEWAQTTELASGLLRVDRDALVAHLLEQDQRLTSVELEIVRAGESCRIYPVFDIAEPRYRTDGVTNFPGAIGPVSSVGDGITAVLRGMAVTIVSPEPVNPDGPLMNQLLDMRPLAIDENPAVELPTSYGALTHLVLLPRVVPGLDRYERSNTLRGAILRASVYLARAASDQAADAEQTFELGPTWVDLPRIAYVFQLHSHQRPTAPGEPIIYGDNARHLLPTVLHPNEVLDGAILPGYNSMGMETYAVQNHGVIADLYRRHGVDLNFVGVVAVVAHQTVDERGRTNVIAANLVRHTLRADGAVFTKSGGGAPHVAMAEVARACEQLGVKSSLLAWEISEGETGPQDSALFNYPELNAIVNYGCNGFGVPMAPVERVVTLDAAVAAKLKGAMNANANRMCGAMDQLGSGVLTAARY